MKTNPWNEIKVNIGWGEKEENCRKTKAVFEGYKTVIVRVNLSFFFFFRFFSCFIWQQFNNFLKRGMKIRNYWNWVENIKKTIILFNRNLLRWQATPFLKQSSIKIFSTSMDAFRFFFFFFSCDKERKKRTKELTAEMGDEKNPIENLFSNIWIMHKLRLIQLSWCIKDGQLEEVFKRINWRFLKQVQFILSYVNQ